MSTIQWIIYTTPFIVYSISKDILKLYMWENVENYVGPISQLGYIIILFMILIIVYAAIYKPPSKKDIGRDSITYLKSKMSLSFVGTMILLVLIAPIALLVTYAAGHILLFDIVLPLSKRRRHGVSGVTNSIIALLIGTSAATSGLMITDISPIITSDSIDGLIIENYCDFPIEYDPLGVKVPPHSSQTLNKRSVSIRIEHQGDKISVQGPHSQYNKDIIISHNPLISIKIDGQPLIHGDSREIDLRQSHRLILENR